MVSPVCRVGGPGWAPCPRPELCPARNGTGVVCAGRGFGLTVPQGGPRRPTLSGCAGPAEPRVPEPANPRATARCCNPCGLGLGLLLKPAGIQADEAFTDSFTTRAVKDGSASSQLESQGHSDFVVAQCLAATLLAAAGRSIHWQPQWAGRPISGWAAGAAAGGVVFRCGGQLSC